LSPSISVAQDFAFDFLELPEFEYHLELDLACYDFAGAQALALADREYRQTKVELTDCFTRRALLEAEVETLRDATDGLQADLDQSYVDFDESMALLAAAETQNAKLLKRPHPAVVVLVVVGTGLAAFGIGVGVGVGVNIGPP